MLSAFRLPGFRWVAAIYAFDYLVELASSVALMVLVYDATDSPLAAAAMLVCKQVVPGVIAASFGSVLDKVTIRRGLTISYGLSAVTMGVLAVLGYGPILFVLAVVAGTTGAAVRALLRTAVARSTEGPELRAANGMLNVLMGIVSLLGPAAGALLVSQTSTTATLAVTAVGAAALTLICAALPSVVGGVRVGQVGAEDSAADPAPKNTSTVSSSRLLVLGGLLIGLFAMDEPALLGYAQDSLESGVGGYGLLLTAWGAGMIAGSLVYGRVMHHPMPWIFAAGSIATALGYIGLGLAPDLSTALVVACLGGAGNGVLWVALVTAIQESAAPSEQARFAARLEGVALATPALGVLAGGLVAEFVSLRGSLLIPGVAALVAVAIWLLIERAQMRAARPSSLHSLDPAEAHA